MKNWPLNIMYIYFVLYDNRIIDLSLNFIICWTNQYLKYLFIIATGRYSFFSFLLTSHAWTPDVTERKKFPPAVVSNPDQPSAETSMLPTWQPRDDRGRDATVTNNDWLADYLHDNANFKNKKKKKKQSNPVIGIWSIHQLWIEPSTFRLERLNICHSLLWWGLIAPPYGEKKV